MEVEDMEIDDTLKEQDEEDCEYEEFLVYIDIDPTLLSESQIKEVASAKVFGIETKKPLLKIGNQFFEGEYDLSMGTHTFFEKDPSTPVDELYCKTDCYYKFAAKTNKVLKMSRVLIQDNATSSTLTEDKNVSDTKEQLEVKNTYEQALNLFLAPGRSAPRKIPEELNGGNIINLKT